MEKMEMATQKRSLTPPLAELLRGLEWRLLDASFPGYDLPLQTHTIQTLAFKLGCDFSGLSLSITTLRRMAQALDARLSLFQALCSVGWARHAVPCRADSDACGTGPKELRPICIYFFTAHFFQNANLSLLNNYVLGAQLGHGHVNNLREPVNISFWHSQSLEGHTATCVFWKEGASQHHWGVWSPEGCLTEQPSPFQVLCCCNHLSYFAVLMVPLHSFPPQLSPAPVPAELLVALMCISLVGCSISVVASLLTILLHFQARKQSDSLTNIHMNLHASVLLLNVTFLLSPMLDMPSMPGSACTALAAILHFALLSCLTWMATEGFTLCLLLGRVYNIYIHRYTCPVLKLCAVRWVSSLISSWKTTSSKIVTLIALKLATWQGLGAQSSPFPCRLPSGILFQQPQGPMTDPFWGPPDRRWACVTVRGSSPPGAVPPAVKSSVCGPDLIPVSDGQEEGLGFHSMSMCWVQSRRVHTVLVRGYGGLTSLFNLVVLAWVLRTLSRLWAQEKALGAQACWDAVTVLGLTVLLGTTWALASPPLVAGSFSSYAVSLLAANSFFLFLWFCSQRCRLEAEVEAEVEAFSTSQTML
ncbi:hypothetical protein MC885_005998 [Smutsia gigantea]|nr:hypothetical protein MC885_005998 [Smutsia gigantea]